MKTRLQNIQKVATGLSENGNQDSGIGTRAGLPGSLGFESADLIGLVWIALSVISMSIAFAHDTGLGHSRRTLLWEAGPDRFVLEYRIHLPEDEVILEMVKIDADGNGEISDLEKESFFKQKGKTLATMFTVTDLKPVSALFSTFSLGHSFTQTYRFEFVSDSHVLTFEDGNFRDKPGSARVLKSKTTKVTFAQPEDLLHAEVLNLRIERVPAQNDGN
ncbi:MAG: hypothetical protein O3B01_21320 [Planctomycetota bacterium]|nr:hypothetical protein [Planctomycetota bacterium]